MICILSKLFNLLRYSSHKSPMSGYHIGFLSDFSRNIIIISKLFFSQGACMTYQSSETLSETLGDFNTVDCFPLKERTKEFLTIEDVSSTKLKVDAVCVNTTNVGLGLNVQCTQTIEFFQFEVNSNLSNSSKAK